MRVRTLRNLSWCVVLGALATGCDGDGNGLDGIRNNATGKFPGPQFPGAGQSAAGNAIAAGTPVVSCDGPAPLPAGTFGPAPGAQGAVTCFYTAADPVTPAATVEWIVETASVGDLVHVRLTLNPSFVDNTYGDNAIGWVGKTMPGMPGMGGPGMPGKAPKPGMMGKAAHTFEDLVGSDHAEFKITDARGVLISHFKADYISASASAPSGYATLGVSGGEGKMIVGSAADIVAVSTSLDRDLNACGLGGYTVDSPATDSLYTANNAALNWDYRVIYDVWVRRAAFGAAGFGAASVDFVHASPSKAGENTLTVDPGPCPPSWPYCTDPAGCCTVGDQFNCGPNGVPPSKPPVCTDYDAGCPIGF